jgi:hypothetical protein
MARVTVILLATQFLVTGASGIAAADASIVQRSDGTAGTITHLGDDTGIYSDAHGNTGPLINPGNPAPASGGPHGDATAGHLTPFGTPAPPSNLTPAPVLPFNPNRSLAPPQPLAPSTASPSFGPSSGGRFGR